MPPLVPGVLIQAQLLQLFLHPYQGVCVHGIRDKTNLINQNCSEIFCFWS